jgi:DNA-binding response OmpR family regulator
VASDRKRILVVEDNPDDAKVMVAVLGSEGYETRHATTGSQALQIFDEVAPDCVVLDMLLPEGPDGFDVCRQIRAKSGIPIILVSARDEEVDTVVGLELGADGYIVKPFRPREFVARIRAMLR